MNLKKQILVKYSIISHILLNTEFFFLKLNQQNIPKRFSFFFSRLFKNERINESFSRVWILSVWRLVDFEIVGSLHLAPQIFMIGISQSSYKMWPNLVTCKSSAIGKASPFLMSWSKKKSCAFKTNWRNFLSSCLDSKTSRTRQSVSWTYVLRKS